MTTTEAPIKIRHRKCDICAIQIALNHPEIEDVKETKEVKDTIMIASEKSIGADDADEDADETDWEEFRAKFETYEYQWCDSYQAHALERHMSRIVDRLYLGGNGNATNLVELKHFGITTILTMASELTLPKRILNAQTLSPVSKVYGWRKFSWLDEVDYPIERELIQAADEINTQLQSGQTILVHCMLGVSRSASAVIAYLIKYHFMSYDTAYFLVKSARPMIRPNAGFVKKLGEFARSITGKSEESESELSAAI